jgi:hypothetical protein
MLGEYQRLIDVNERLKKCKEMASSRESVAELQEWLNKEAPTSISGDNNLFTTISGLNQSELTGFVLPDAGMSTGKAGNKLTSPKIGSIGRVSIYSNRWCKKYRNGILTFFL